MAVVCCREKAVLVAVYEERPSRRRRLPPPLDKRIVHQHHHHHYHHNRSDDIGTGKRYGNRRADLLNYAGHLRASARPSFANSNPQTKQVSTPQIAGGEVRKLKQSARSPACFGKWKFVQIPSSLRSMTGKRHNERKKKHKSTSTVFTTTKMKALVKGIQVQKKGNFLSKLFASLRKHRH